MSELPRRSGRQGSGPRYGSYADGEPGGPRILVVDDDGDTRRYLRSCIASLGPAGVVVVEASDGARALELARRARPDLVVCDVVMPGLDGPALCRRLRSDDHLAGVPVLFVTGRLGRREAEDEARACGADAALAKPFNAHGLCEAIEALLPSGRNP